MKPEEQRIAIAEACGWTKIHQPVFGIDNLHGIFPNGNLSIYVPVPNYLTDLNAMHEAEKYVTHGQMDADQWEQYGRELQLVHPTAILTTNGVVDYYEFATLAHCTAAQRAEAFLRTFNLWKD